MKMIEATINGEFLHPKPKEKIVIDGWTDYKLRSKMKDFNQMYQVFNKFNFDTKDLAKSFNVKEQEIRGFMSQMILEKSTNDKKDKENKRLIMYKKCKGIFVFISRAFVKIIPIFCFIMALTVVYILLHFCYETNFWRNFSSFREFDGQVFIMRLIIVDATLTSFALVFYGNLIQWNNNDDDFFISKTNLYTCELKETFLSKFIPRKLVENELESTKFVSLSRKIIDKIFGISVKNRLIFLIAFTVLELLFYAFGNFEIVIFLFLLNIYFVFEIIFSVHHYSAFVKYDMNIVFSNIYFFGRNEEYLNYKQWKKKYYKSLMKFICKIKNSGFYDYRKKRNCLGRTSNEKVTMDRYNLFLKRLVTYLSMYRMQEIEHTDYADFIIYNTLHYYPGDLSNILRVLNHHTTMTKRLNYYSIMSILKSIYKQKEFTLLLTDDNGVSLLTNLIDKNKFYDVLYQLFDKNKEYQIVAEKQLSSINLRVDWIKLRRTFCENIHFQQAYRYSSDRLNSSIE